jgi:hypothetical protein
MRRLLARMAAVLPFALAGVPAGVATAVQGPVTPVGVQQQLSMLLAQFGARDLALTPTRLPVHYQYESFSISGSPAGIDLTYVDQRFLKDATIAHQHEIGFDSGYLGGPSRCASGSRTSFRENGTVIYAGAPGGVKSVWRCVAGSHGRDVKLSAHGPVPDRELAVLLLAPRAMKR